MEFRILGPLEVVEAGRSLPLGGARQRALLALLLTRANEVVSTDRLIDELWGERPPKAALNTVQFYVSRLRKTLAPREVIVTQAPGYLARVEPGQLDLHRFERLTEAGGRALAEERANEAATRLREALALWRGPPLADFASERFAQIEIARLEELRLATLEHRIEADLALGRHAELVGELEALSAEHPLRELLRGQLMLALYRSGRQADALDVYQKTRRALVEQLAIEPSPALRELERSILRQDTSLATGVQAIAPARAIGVAVREPRRLDSLLALAEPLSRRAGRELIVWGLVEEQGRLEGVTALLLEWRAALIDRGVAVRTAAFTSAALGEDVVRVSSQHDIDLLLLDAPTSVLVEGRLGSQLEVVLAGVPSDVGFLIERGIESPAPGPDRPVLVPFGGAEHDWAAIELAAWIARGHGASLKLLGSAGDRATGRQDASRLLATASLVVQRVVGIPTEPLLAPRGQRALVAAADDAGLFLAGLSDRWRHEGLGKTRLELARRIRPPALFVRRGLRPGGLAPDESLTRFTWSLRA